MLRPVLLVLAVVALPSLAEAESLNCRHARHADEIAICNDLELSRWTNACRGCSSNLAFPRPPDPPVFMLHSG